MQPSLEFLINVQHVYSIFSDFSLLHALIRNYTFIKFKGFFPPACLFPPAHLLIQPISEKNQLHIATLPFLYIYMIIFMLVGLSVCPFFVRPPVCPFVCLFVPFLFVHLLIRLSVCLPKIVRPPITLLLGISHNTGQHLNDQSDH